jgi:hypothetical protein
VLFKNHSTVLAGDHDRAQLPFDFAERIDPGRLKKRSIESPARDAA